MVTILFASPRDKVNTASLLKPFIETLKSEGEDIVFFNLYAMEIEGCRACRACQDQFQIFGCPIEDDMHRVFDSIIKSDLILLASPVYSWYVTAPLKAALDRLVYGMNKYYGKKRGPCLWENKAMALLVSCGYPPQRGADLLEEGMRRYAKHSGLRYLGMLAEQDKGYNEKFMDQEKEKRVGKFARELLRKLYPCDTSFIG